jgi:hypothetical protein
VRWRRVSGNGFTIQDTLVRESSLLDRAIIACMYIIYLAEMEEINVGTSNLFVLLHSRQKDRPLIFVGELLFVHSRFYSVDTVAAAQPHMSEYVSWLPGKREELETSTKHRNATPSLVRRHELRPHSLLTSVTRECLRPSTPSLLFKLHSPSSLKFGALLVIAPILIPVAQRRVHYFAIMDSENQVRRRPAPPRASCLELHAWPEC